MARNALRHILGHAPTEVFHTEHGYGRVHGSPIVLTSLNSAVTSIDFQSPLILLPLDQPNHSNRIISLTVFNTPNPYFFNRFYFSDAVLH